MPLDTRGACYNREAAPHLRVRSLVLRSRVATLRPHDHGALAVAVFADGALHLSPLASCVQLRPSLGHLDAADDKKRIAEADAAATAAQAAPGGGRAGGAGGSAAAAAAAAAADDDDEEEEEEEGVVKLTPLQVQVRQRETERQTAARLQSHAHLKAVEEEEPWVRLTPHGDGSADAEALRRRIHATQPGAECGARMPAAAYLAKLLPPRPSTTATHRAAQQGQAQPPPQAQQQQQQQQQPPPAAASHATAPSAAPAVGGAAAHSRPGSSIDAPAGEALKDFAHGRYLFSCDTARALVAANSSPPAACSSPDEAIASVLGPSWALISGRMVRLSAGEAAADDLRAAVASLMAEKWRGGGPLVVKRADVAARLGSQPGASLYARVMGQLCVSHGGAWTLRTGHEAA